MNFLLDRVFANQLIEDTYIGIMGILLEEKDNRDFIINLLEKDYEHYKLDIWKPELATKKQVQLPSPVFSNVYQLFRILLEKTDEPSKENID